MDKMDGRAYEEDEREAEELDPAVEWRQAGDEQDLVEIRLPGFRKEHVRVQVDNYGVLRVTGGRPSARGWVRFTKDLRLPDGCDADGVRARFEDDRLLITLPIVAGDTASPTTPLPRTSSFQPPPSVAPRPPLLPSFSAKAPTVPEPKPPPPPPPPPAKPSAFEPKFRPPLPAPREPLSHPHPPFPATAFGPKPPPPPPQAPSFRSRPPPPPVPSTSFMSRPPPPPQEPAARLPSFPKPPPPREPARLPSFPPPLAKPTFFDSKHWLPRRHPDHTAAAVPEPTNSATAAAEQKPWAPPAIVPGPKTTEPEPRPTPPPFPPLKQSIVPEPKSPALSDIPIIMSSPSPPPPRWRIPDAKDRRKMQEGAGNVRLPLLEEMKKKEEKKMEGRKAREAAFGGSRTPPAVDERREMTTPKLPLPPAATTTDLVANMAAAAAVLVGIAVSVWRTMSRSS